LKSDRQTKKVFRRHSENLFFFLINLLGNMAKTRNKPLCHHSHFLCFIILAFTPSFSQKQKNQKQKPKIPSFPRRRESNSFGFSRFR
ncbi:hypothetical protein ACHZTW_002010, partial [Neisseria gonorrhoeae]